MEHKIFLNLKKKKFLGEVKIAFINPPHADWCLANNAAYLMFQSHYKRYGKYSKNIKWIDAPYKFNKYECVQDIYKEIKDADIFLFSSYIWNYDVCDELAQYIKSQKTQSICVLGGPQIGTNDPKFLETRKYYDFISQPTKPGEIFVENLIDSYIENDGKPNYSDITWELRSDRTCDQFMPDYSVYEDHIDYLKVTREYARKNELEPFCIIETTRGCPYRCSFCEWGGGIDSKIYKKPIDIVKRDLLALKEAGFRDIYLTDANFGAFFERDVEIFKFAWNNRVNLTDISTMKSRDLKRRIKLVDAWFDVVGNGPETHSVVNTKKEGMSILVLGAEGVAEKEDEPMYISVVPTVSIQSISDEAMRVAERIDLSFEDKIKLSEHIHKKCHEQNFPVPAIELILGMPGSTKEDFYNEMNILWNFKSWNSFRHDYMFLPDSDLSNEEYLKKYKIVLIDVYSDLVDEWGVDNQNSFYKNKRTHFKTISSCYSFTLEDMCEMWFMNIAGNYILKNIYSNFSNDMAPSIFAQEVYKLISQFDAYESIYEEIQKILDPTKPVSNIKRLKGKLRNEVIEEFISQNEKIIFSEIYSNFYLQETA
jgi:tRNA A37 methylthiotransferase MiaB